VTEEFLNGTAKEIQDQRVQSFILTLAARKIVRMKEIGIPEVMSGQKRHIFTQFVMESTIMMRFCSDAVVFFLRGHSQ
jgi:hypothetical protein